MAARFFLCIGCLPVNILLAVLLLVYFIYFSLSLSFSLLSISLLGFSPNPSCSPFGDHHVTVGAGIGAGGIQITVSDGWVGWPVKYYGITYKSNRKLEILHWY